MNYNDFPILTDDEYLKMKNEYFTSTDQSNNIIFEICLKLHECKNSFLYLNKIYNSNLYSSLNFAKKEISELYDNLIYSYKINTDQFKIINEFNIFLLLENLITIIKQTNLARTNKQLQKSNTTLLNSIENKIILIVEKILKNLKHSNFYFFKHM